LGVADCPGFAPPDAAPYHRHPADSLALLAGVYELIALNLSGGEHALPYRARLALVPSQDADTLTVLRGTATWMNHEGNPQFTETATVDSRGNLFVDSNDIRTDYRLVAINRSGLWGLWEKRLDESQFGLIETATNRDLPNPAGVFCIVRKASWNP
jgi:hypothetical protein